MFLCITKAVGIPTVEINALLTRNIFCIIDRLRTNVRVPNFAILLQGTQILINLEALSCLLLAGGSPKLYLTLLMCWPSHMQD